MDKLTPEQIKNWRVALLQQLGPYAFICEDELIQHLYDRLQQRLDEEEKLRKELEDELRKSQEAMDRIKNRMEGKITDSQIELRNKIMEKLYGRKDKETD